MSVKTPGSSSVDDEFAAARHWMTRAHGQQAALSNRVRALLRDLRFTVRAGADAQTGDEVFRFRPDAEIPRDIIYLAQDAARTLRRALDITYRTVCSSRLQLLPRDRRFPFARSARAFERKLSSQRKVLSITVRSLIRNVEAYPDGDDWMAALPGMCRCPPAKLLEMQTCGSVRLSGDGVPYAGAASIQAPTWRPQSAAMELRLQDPSGQLNGRYRLLQRVVLRYPKLVAGEDVIQVLGYQTSQVENLLETLSNINRPARPLSRSA